MRTIREEIALLKAASTNNETVDVLLKDGRRLRGRVYVDDHWLETLVVCSMPAESGQSTGTTTLYDLGMVVPSG